MADQPTVQIPADAFARLVKVAMHVSVGRGFAFAGQGPYPDATARRALGELAELGLIPVAMREEPATQPEPDSCAHCGKTIRRITGTLAEWWVHEPGGHTICFPEQPSSSPRATPKLAAGAQPSEPPIIAYQSGSGRLLRCTRHAPAQVALSIGAYRPVTAEDLPNGGICTYGDCGVDVLIPQDGAHP